jgi:hypothetical protein
LEFPLFGGSRSRIAKAKGCDGSNKISSLAILGSSSIPQEGYLQFL